MIQILCLQYLHWNEDVTMPIACDHRSWLMFFNPLTPETAWFPEKWEWWNWNNEKVNAEKIILSVSGFFMGYIRKMPSNMEIIWVPNYSNELQHLDFRIRCQVISPSNGHQGDISYCAVFQELQLLQSQVELILHQGEGLASEVEESDDPERTEKAERIRQRLQDLKVGGIYLFYMIFTKLRNWFPWLLKIVISNGLKSYDRTKQQKM